MTRQYFRKAREAREASLPHPVDDPALYTVAPRLIERQCGGWLAVTPKRWPLSVGVTGETIEDTEQKFRSAMLRWSEIKVLP